MKRKKAPFIQMLLSILLWLCIWQAASMALDMDFLLVSPLTAGKRFCELAVTSAFWLTIGNTCLRILAGFLIAITAGILTAALSQWKEWIGVFLSPLILAIRTGPMYLPGTASI